ncbi:hypothetical protein NDU88_000550 [Pleurodeles waltl]|uniref:Retrotransposon gag domain-containing protein n=1 Tax=Pleurodeles waltl TaxID=8319 RepID=A0AAV7S9Y2_PLEWA|nr:hypothetical protein NDU88_000550 [Pleurodeles waltl]
MENHSESHEIDIEEIIKAAREAAATRSKEWILKQIRGDQASGSPAQEGHDSDSANVPTRGEVEQQTKAKKRQRNASRGAKKGDKKETGELPKPGPSKQAKANMGEQINAIVQECLKSMAPLLFAKPRGVKRHRRAWGRRTQGGCNPQRHQGKGGPTAKAATPPDHCPSPSRGEEETTARGNRTSPTQAWGGETKGSRRRQNSARSEGLTPDAYKRGSLGRTYMVARAPGLASMIPLAVKERIWRREFIDIFSLLEIQVEGLDLTTVDKKEEDRRERNKVKKERNFDNWLDAFRIMACIRVEKFPHCAKDLWLYESKIHEAQRQFAGDAWLDYDKGFRLKMQAHPEMEWDEEDVAGYMHKMMVAREARSWANKGEQPFRWSFHKGRQEKAKPFYKKPQYSQWKGPQAGKGATAVCYKYDKD